MEGWVFGDLAHVLKPERGILQEKTEATEGIAAILLAPNSPRLLWWEPMNQPPANFQIWAIMGLAGILFLLIFLLIMWPGGDLDMIASEEHIANVRAKCGRSIEEILAKAPNHDLYEILGAIEVLVGSKICQQLATTLAERMVFAFKWMAIEVNNGGFDQYFFNSAGDFWKDVFEGLQIIGDRRGLASFRQVISIFPDASPSTDRFTRQEQLSALEEQDEKRYWKHFEKVSRAYWRKPFPKWELVYDYVKTHRNEFDLRAA